MVTKTRVVLEVVSGDGGGGVATTPAAAWATRREIAWRVHTETLGTRTPTDPSVGSVTVALINAGERPDGTRLEVMRMTVDVETGDEDPVAKVMTMLDMGSTTSGSDEPVSIAAPTGRSVIGPMPAGWALGRRLSGYERDVSGPDGEVGMSAWQINGGSWVLLPVAGSGTHVFLTVETVVETAQTGRMDVVVDRRRVGDAPDEVGRELRAAGPQIVRFDAGPGGFVMEAGDERRSWRFQMDADLPAGVDMSGKWLIVHDLHLQD